MDWKGFNDQELGLLILLLYPSVIFSELLNSYDKLTVGNKSVYFFLFDSCEVFWLNWRLVVSALRPSKYENLFIFFPNWV